MVRHLACHRDAMQGVSVPSDLNGRVLSEAFEP